MVEPERSYAAVVVRESPRQVITRPLESEEQTVEPLLIRLADGAEHLVDRPIHVGQSEGNELVLADAHVSRRHCVIEPMRGRVVVRDLGSTNGTYVNGVRVPSAILGSGTVVEVGHTRLRLVRAGGSCPILGESPAVRELRRQIGVLAPSPLAVLILGETGTGKELIAQALHDESGRRGPFVPLNCGAIAKDLVESELFGHEKGAFTGALGRRSGVFQEADGGTLFLDEIGELPLALQSRLLRALETGCVRPVGSNKEVPVRVRVVAATHVDLGRAAKEGRFRADLFFRLNGAILISPPLRERREDIALLARHFLTEFAREGGASRLSEAALAALSAHDWPGNVRELRHLLMRAAILRGPVLEPKDLGLLPARPAPPAQSDESVRIDGRPFSEIEKEILVRSIRRHGNRRRAAHALSIPKSTFCDKAKRYGIPLNDDER
jgi:DNA-binding NtrC family response regulator